MDAAAKSLLAIHEALDKNSSAIKIRLQTHGRQDEFNRRLEKVARQFEAVLTQNDPEAALSHLGLAIYDLQQTCLDYEYIAEFLDEIEDTVWDAVLTSGTRLSSSPTEEPQFNPKEIANRYYDLLAKLIETSDREDR